MGNNVGLMHCFYFKAGNTDAIVFWVKCRLTLNHTRDWEVNAHVTLIFNLPAHKGKLDLEP